MKRIIICADGTWNEPDQLDKKIRKPTNVVKVARGIEPIDAKNIPQIVYYDQGVGTHIWLIDKLIGGMTGFGLEQNILDCYLFLATNYVKGDEIYLFGFSRGAYTVRSLSGMIGTVGLLPKTDIFFLKEAFKFYRKPDISQIIYNNKTKKRQLSTLEEFQIDKRIVKPEIHFIGVWDTVGALGLPFIPWQHLFGKRHAFHNTKVGSHVKRAYHALAIDEKRKPFKPILWNPESLRPDQTLEQKWFAGVHSNVGGGYKDDGLANCALNWIVSKAKEVGLEFNTTFIKHYKNWACDTIEDSFTFMYRLLGKHVRKIGQLPNKVDVPHETAIQRLNSDECFYQPPNLLDYLKQKD